MLRMSNKEILKIKKKRRTHYMFKANMEKIKSDIIDSTSSKHAKGMDMIIGRGYLVTEAFIELESILADLRIERENIGYNNSEQLKINSKKYLNFLDIWLHKYQFPGVTLSECVRDIPNFKAVHLPFEGEKFEILENKIEESFRNFDGLINEESQFSFSEFASDIQTFDNLTLDSVQQIDKIKLEDFDLREKISMINLEASFRSERQFMNADVLTESMFLKEESEIGESFYSERDSEFMGDSEYYGQTESQFFEEGSEDEDGEVEGDLRERN